MGATRDEFVRYPRTPHLFGSKGTDDDKHLGPEESKAFIADPSLIVEEKLDGTNVGIHFSQSGRMVLQCRGHEITEGMHPQYDLFKQWTAVKRPVLEAMLAGQFILYGEWLYAKHSVHYCRLSHYFFEFDIYDKDSEQFLNLEQAPSHASRHRANNGPGAPPRPGQIRPTAFAHRTIGLRKPLREPNNQRNRQFDGRPILPDGGQRLCERTGQDGAA